MRLKLSSASRLALLAITCVLFAVTTVATQAKDLKFEAQLIWATTSETSPDPNQKPVNEETRKFLSRLPLKWKNYFLVKKVEFSVSPSGSKEVKLSEKCRILVKDIDGENLEVGLIGKGEPVLKRTQKLLKDNSLVLGGNAPDSTGWLVVLKRTE